MSHEMYITVTNPAFYDTVRAHPAAGETNWTVNSAARTGDRMLLYVTAPISAIVAQAILATDPVMNESPGDPWFGHYMADMHSLRLLKQPVTRKRLIEVCPSWGYPRQPRNSVRIPREYQRLIEGLMDGARIRVIKHGVIDLVDCDTCNAIRGEPCYVMAPLHTGARSERQNIKTHPSRAARAAAVREEARV